MNPVLSSIPMLPSEKKASTAKSGEAIPVPAPDLSKIKNPEVKIVSPF